MIPLFEYGLVELFCLKVRRITVDESCGAIPLPDQVDGALVLYNHILQPFGGPLDLIAEAANVVLLHPEGGACTAEAPSADFIEHDRSPHIPQGCPLAEDGLDLGYFIRIKALLSDCHLSFVALHIQLRERLVIHEGLDVLKLGTGMIGEEAKFFEKFQKMIPDTDHKIDEICIEVIVDVKSGGALGEPQQNGSTASKGFNVGIKLRGEDLEDIGGQLFFAAHPGKEWTGNSNHPLSGPKLSKLPSSPSMAASSPERIFLRCLIVLYTSPAVWA